jgi:glycosyltransferase involved in cell wall biosynthesis
MNWTLICATNDERILRGCLLNSPDVGSASDVLLQTGYTSAAAAYNAAIDKAKTDILVFAHQDAYLPDGWIAALRRTLDVLSTKDPNWAILGVWGVKNSGGGVGYLYCAGLMEKLGNSFEDVVEVSSLDEVVLIVRKASGLRFDERLSGYHFYGTDICLEAKRRGLKCYAISAFCIHNTNGYNLLPFGFWRSYLFIRRKWMSELPIHTSCIEVTSWCWPIFRWNIARIIELVLGKNKAGKRVSDPSELFRKMFKTERTPTVTVRG